MKDDTLIGCITAVVLVLSFFIFVSFMVVNANYYNTMVRCLEMNGSWTPENGQFVCRINGVCTQ
jgi:hypothetical protein